MTRAPRLLIVDDDQDFAAAISALFEGAGYETRSAPNGGEGLRLARATRPDVILLDVMMRDRTEGFFALQALREAPELARTRVIVLSSIYIDFPHFRVDPMAGWLPADLFLAKPVDPARLVKEVERLLDRGALDEDVGARQG